MNNNLGKLAIFILLFILNTSVAVANVSAYLNQNTVYEGDTITLNIESSVNTDARPDLTVLNKDFAVLSTSSSSQINIFNGQRSFKKTWTVELKPKTTDDTIQIPAIKVGNETTRPLNIKVTALPPEIKAETEKHVFLETSVGISGNETYVQQQIPYMVKLYFDSAMKSGEITQPTVKNAVVEELTQDKRYTVMRGGKKFNVVEKHYTISPEKSGTLHIPATSVSGRIALSGGDSPQLRQRMDETDMLNKFFNNFQNDPFFNDPFFRNNLDDGFLSRARSTGPSKPFTIKSKALDITVKPVPKEFTGKVWLPAKELSIRDSWTHTPPELKVGEPVTRTLVLRAKGLAGSQIPTIEVAKPDNVKIYPQQPTSKTHTDGETLIGRQYFDITYIPQKAGQVDIPEIKVDWWNIDTKKQQTYTLPAWHLNVAPGALASQTTGVDAAENNTAENTTDNNKQANNITDNPASQKGIITDQEKSNSRWKMLSLFTLLLLTLGAGLFFASRKFYKETGKSQNQARNTKPSISIKALKDAAIRACDKNDKQAAAKAILKLAQAQWGDNSIQNLGTLKTQLENGAEIIDQLNTSLYSSNAEAWQGKKLKELIETGLKRKQANKNTSEDVLAPLYPE